MGTLPETIPSPWQPRRNLSCTRPGFLVVIFLASLDLPRNVSAAMFWPLSSLEQRNVRRRLNAQSKILWALGAVASASRLHRVGRGFESLSAHHLAVAETKKKEIKAAACPQVSSARARFFPNRHHLFHLIDQPLAGRKRLAAMRRYDFDPKRRRVHRDTPKPVYHPNTRDRPPLL
jgi:hypothetical protein